MNLTLHDIRNILDSFGMSVYFTEYQTEQPKPEEPKMEYIDPIEKIVNDGNTVKLMVELPGVEREDVSVTVDGLHVTVRVSKKLGKPVSFVRQWKTSDSTYYQWDRTTSRLTNGILYVEIPISSSCKERNVRID